MNQPLSEIETSLMEMCEQAREKNKKVSYEPFDLDNFVEAIQNLPDGQWTMFLSLCIDSEKAAKEPNSAKIIIMQSRCHRYLMNCIKIYLKEAEIYNRHPSLDGDC